MKTMFIALILCVLTASCIGLEGSGGKSGAVYEGVELKAASGVASSAAFFKGDSEEVVVFIPGAVFDKGSWFFLAQLLQEKGVGSLSLDGKTKQDVFAAIEWATVQGFKHVILVGSSMGGAAVLDALEGKANDRVSKVILLAPAGGSAIDSQRIDKLFIVSKEDALGLYGDVLALYKSSSEPKALAVFEGNAHAQHLFKTDQKQDVAKRIVDFVVEK